MAIHTEHDSIGSSGLADGCPRCDEHAEHPFWGLDDSNLGSLVFRIDNDLTPRSDNERRAMYLVREALHMAERVARVRKVGK